MITPNSAKRLHWHLLSIPFVSAGRRARFWGKEYYLVVKAYWHNKPERKMEIVFSKPVARVVLTTEERNDRPCPTTCTGHTFAATKPDELCGLRKWRTKENPACGSTEDVIRKRQFLPFRHIINQER